MKKLSQLKISPAPWRVSDAQHYWIEDANRKMVCDGLTFRGNGENADAEERANACLIAAAPKLYDMLQSLVDYIDRECLMEAVREKCPFTRMSCKHGEPCDYECGTEKWRKALEGAKDEPK